MLRKTLVVLLLTVLVIPTGAYANDPGELASDLSKMLKSKRYQEAAILWEESEAIILDNLFAAIKAGKAWIDFGGSDLAMRYQQIPEDCAEIAMECADTIADKMMDDDLESRYALGQLELDIAEVWLKRGHGDKAEKLHDRAFENLKLVAAGDKAPVTVYMDLGRLYGRFAKREPQKGEEHIAKAAECFEMAKEKAGDSAALCLRIGQTKCQLAELRAESLLRTPKDRKLKKAVVAAWEETLEAFEAGLKLQKDNAELKTAYNECLWEFMRANGGKAKRKPIMKAHDTRYHKIKFQLPDSTAWKITEQAELEDGEVLEMTKYNMKAGKALTIWIDQYKWDCSYSNEETGESIGGDNIGGLAKRSERSVNDIFEDVKDRMPLRKCRLSGKIPKCEGFCVKGRTESGNLMEWRCVFFKHSKVQRTFRMIILADMGMLERNPYELKLLLNTFSLARKRR